MKMALTSTRMMKLECLMIKVSLGGHFLILFFIDAHANFRNSDFKLHISNTSIL
jgi:hypothetical protein